MATGMATSRPAERRMGGGTASRPAPEQIFGTPDSVVILDIRRSGDDLRESGSPATPLQWTAAPLPWSRLSCEVGAVDRRSGP
jgi:hypothetical protein